MGKKRKLISTDNPFMRSLIRTCGGNKVLASIAFGWIAGVAIAQGEELNLSLNTEDFSVGADSEIEHRRSQVLAYSLVFDKENAKFELRRSDGVLFQEFKLENPDDANLVTGIMSKEEFLETNNVELLEEKKAVINGQGCIITRDEKSKRILDVRYSDDEWDKSLSSVNSIEQLCNVICAFGNTTANVEKVNESGNIFNVKVMNTGKEYQGEIDEILKEVLEDFGLSKQEAYEFMKSRLKITPSENELDDKKCYSKLLENVDVIRTKINIDSKNDKDYLVYESKKDIKNCNNIDEIKEVNDLDVIKEMIVESWKKIGVSMSAEAEAILCYLESVETLKRIYCMIENSTSDLNYKNILSINNQYDKLTKINFTDISQDDANEVTKLYNYKNEKFEYNRLHREEERDNEINKFLSTKINGKKVVSIEDYYLDGQKAIEAKYNEIIANDYEEVYEIMKLKGEVDEKAYVDKLEREFNTDMMIQGMKYFEKDNVGKEFIFVQCLAGNIDSEMLERIETRACEIIDDDYMVDKSDEERELFTRTFYDILDLSTREDIQSRVDKADRESGEFELVTKEDNDLEDAR